jgi:hypothetical protein
MIRQDSSSSREDRARADLLQRHFHSGTPTPLGTPFAVERDRVIGDDEFCGAARRTDDLYAPSVHIVLNWNWHCVLISFSL